MITDHPANNLGECRPSHQTQIKVDNLEPIADCHTHLKILSDLLQNADVSTSENLLGKPLPK